VRRGGLWAKHMGLKRGAIENTLGEHIENFGNILGILVFIFECTPPLAEFSVLSFTISVRIPKFEKNCYN